MRIGHLQKISHRRDEHRNRQLLAEHRGKIVGYATSLIVQLDELYRQEKTKSFKAVAILVPGPSVKPWLEELRKSRGITIPLTVLASGRNDVGVKLYKLDPNVRNTFLVTRNRVVDANVSDIASTGFDQVRQATLSMLTKSAK